VDATTSVNDDNSIYNDNVNNDDDDDDNSMPNLKGIECDKILDGAPINNDQDISNNNSGGNYYKNNKNNDNNTTTIESSNNIDIDDDRAGIDSLTTMTATSSSSSLSNNDNNNNSNSDYSGDDNGDENDENELFMQQLYIYLESIKQKTVTELREICKFYGLAVRGRKEIIIQRIAEVFIQKPELLTSTTYEE
jgi:hypothetical protein